MIINTLGEDMESVHLYRVRALQAHERDQIVGAAVSFLGRPFDSQFRLEAPESGAVYCTLLALRCLARGDPGVFEHVRPQRVSLLDDQVYLPESLLQWERLEHVAA